MHNNRLTKVLWLTLIASVLFFSPMAFADAIVVDHTCTDLSDIPSEWLTAAKDNLHIAYQHTSHGSQLVTGMRALRGFPEFGTTYDWDDAGQREGAIDLDDYGIPGCADLSQGDTIDANGVTPWVTATRALLDTAASRHVNVVMWSWCSINGHDIDRYLENMEILISEYGEGGTKPRAVDHPVQFVFMTGHAEGQGEDGFIFSANERIRQHCRNNDRILFDFADIESHDPDGIYYYDKPMWDDLDYSQVSYRDSNWGIEWLSANDGSELDRLTTGENVAAYDGCEACAHSGAAGSGETINCVLKGQAAWHLYAKLAGWDAAPSDPGDDDDGDPPASDPVPADVSNAASGGCFLQTLRID